MNVTESVTPELVRESDKTVEAVPAAHEDELHVVTTGALDGRRGANCEVDAVLRPHHPEIRAEVALTPPPIWNR